MFQCEEAHVASRERSSYNITITHRTSGDVSTFYRVPFFKALAVMAYLRNLDDVVGYEVETMRVSLSNERSAATC